MIGTLAFLRLSLILRRLGVAGRPGLRVESNRGFRAAKLQLLGPGNLILSLSSAWDRRRRPGECQPR